MNGLYEKIECEDGSVIYAHEDSDVDLKHTLIKACAYDKKKTELSEIFVRSGSNKSTPHSYDYIYNALFHSQRKEEINFFELGISYVNAYMMDDRYPPTNIPAPSLKAWKEYFENGNIYGADFDRATLIQEERIQTFFANVLETQSLVDLADNILRDMAFDIIIDDALHEHGPNMRFLNSFYHKLKDDGLFIIEDINKDTNNIEKYLASLESYKAILILLKHPEAPKWDRFNNNTLAIIKK